MCKILSWPMLFPHPLKIFAILVASGPLYWYLIKIVSRVLTASGVCSGSMAFAQIIARRFLTGAGSESDEKVRSNNPRNAA